MIDHLEHRLERLDLRLDGPGAHIDDERLAVVGAGGEPTEVEALHLAGCDDCLDVLVALGEGLEALATDAPHLSTLMVDAPRATRRPPRRWPTVALLLVAGAAAAAGYFLRDMPAPEPPAEPPALMRSEAGVEPAPVEQPILPADQIVGRASSLDGRSIDGGEVAGRLLAVARRGLDRAVPTLPEPTLPEPALPPTTVAEPDAPVAADAPAAAPPAERRAAPPRRSRAASPRPNAVTPVPGALARRDGPRPLERRPVDGPPRGYGLLQLNTSPAARVFIDGKPRGWTPIIDLRLPEGPHDVRLEFDSELAAEKEQRFRVLIEPDRTWRMTRDNVKRP